MELAIQTMLVKCSKPAKPILSRQQLLKMGEIVTQPMVKNHHGP